MPSSSPPAWTQDTRGAIGPRGLWWRSVHTKPGAKPKVCYRDGFHGDRPDFRQIKVSQSRASKDLYVKALQECAEISAWEHALGLLREMPQAGLQLQSKDYTQVTQSLREYGPWTTACALLQEMKEARLEPLPSMLEMIVEVFAKARRSDLMQSVLQRLRRSTGLSASTLHSAVEASAHAGQWTAVLSLLKESRQTALHVTDEVAGAAMQCLASAGKLGPMLDVLTLMKEASLTPERATYVSAMHGCSRAAMWSAVLELLAEATQQGFRDSVILEQAILGCESEAQLWPEACQWLDEMVQEEAGSLEAFGSVASMCQRAGKFDHKRELLHKGRIFSTRRAWRSARRAEVRQSLEAWDFVQSHAARGNIGSVIAALEHYYDTQLQDSSAETSAASKWNAMKAALTATRPCVHVVDCGCGAGYIALKLAYALQNEGRRFPYHVWAIEDHPVIAQKAKQILDFAGVLQERTSKAGVHLLVGSAAAVTSTLRRSCGCERIDVLHLGCDAKLHHHLALVAAQAGLLQTGSVVVASGGYAAGGVLFLGYAAEQVRRGNCVLDIVPFRKQEWVAMLTHVLPGAVLDIDIAAPFYGLQEEMQRFQAIARTGPVFEESWLARFWEDLRSTMEFEDPVMPEAALQLHSKVVRKLFRHSSPRQAEQEMQARVTSLLDKQRRSSQQSQGAWVCHTCQTSNFRWRAKCVQCGLKRRKK